MPSSEGRNDPFSVLKTFLAEPPEVVMYDFCCSLEEYASNRDPWWFKDTLFVIDRFHWRNHKAYALAVLSVLICSTQLQPCVLLRSVRDPVWNQHQHMRAVPLVSELACFQRQADASS